MPTFEMRRVIPVPRAVAFSVASDVGAYKEFLPLLERSTVRGARNKIGAEEKFKAELVASYAPLRLREAFVSDVTANETAGEVTAYSTDGPFKHVKTCWQVEETAGSTAVRVSIDYALRNPLLQVAVSGLMPMAVEKLMAAFEARALALAAQAC